MRKAKFIELQYTTHASLDLEEEGINPDDIKSTFFKWGMADIELKDGTKHNIHLNTHEVDYKYHEKGGVYDDDYEKIEVDWFEE